ncbi:hypothetical protein BH10CYA1_BH10CYA1_61080 [soil metagenome]
MSTNDSENDCTYEISRFGSTIPCTCSPESAGKTCRCHGLSNPFLRKPPVAVPDHSPMLVAYIRVAGDLASLEEQTAVINDYCLENGFRVAQFFVDTGKPSYALKEAIQAMESHHGLIAVNLQTFVENSEDRLRDLRPFVHHFFCYGNKDLITVEEGIDTSTSQGQIAADDAVTSTTDSFFT